MRLAILCAVVALMLILLAGCGPAGYPEYARPVEKPTPPAPVVVPGKP
jgi:predicted small lipoprotein YifL